MSRLFAAGFALLLTVVAVSSACLANDLAASANVQRANANPSQVRFRSIAPLRFVEFGGGLYSASRL